MPQLAVVYLLFNQFAHIFLSTIDTHAPLKSLTRKEIAVHTMDNKKHFISIKKKHVQILFYKWQLKQ